MGGGEGGRDVQSAGVYQEGWGGGWGWGGGVCICVCVQMVGV